MLLLCDMAAALSSVSRRWLRAVPKRIGVPQAAIRIIEALNVGTALMLSVGGVVTIGLVTPGIAQ